MVNIYASSGVEKRPEREDFFNIELPYLLIDTPTTMIMGAIKIASWAKQTLQATSTLVEP
jgi:hypothetical protein